MIMPGQGTIRISLDDVMNALEDHCYYTHYYLDRETGEIISQSENDLTEREEIGGGIGNPFPVYDSSERYIPLEPMESRRGYDIMKKFAEGLPEGEARRRVLGVLSRRKPFRNFKDALYDYPELGRQWYELHADVMEKVTEEWLGYSRIDFELIPSSRSMKQHE